MSGSLLKFKDTRMYLTYFTNFDSTNKKDIPIIGNAELSFVNASGITFPAVSLMNKQIPSIKWTSYNPAQSFSDMFILDDSIKQISIEYFLSSYYYGDYGTNFTLGYLRFGGAGVRDGVNLYLPNNTGAETTFFNGASLNTQWGRWCYVPCPNDWSWHFYSCVVDYENNEILFYVDGLIRSKVSNITLSKRLSCAFDTHHSTHWINLTQCAIFEYSKCSSDTLTYKVPSKPYVNL